MSCTYSGDPGNSDRDAVRFHIQDTSTTSCVLSDSEVDYALTAAGSVTGAAIMLCEVLIAKYSAKVTQRTDGISVNYSDLVKQYELLLDRLKNGSTNAPTIYAGGISVDDMETNRDDDDWNQPPFRQGQFDNPAAGSVPPGHELDGEV